MFQAIIVRIWFVIPAFLVMCSGASASGPYAGKRILWVESYHEGYPWTDGIAKGVEVILKNTGVLLRIVRMDTKRNASPEFGEAAGRAAWEEMKAFRPHVVMASDDNAQRYFVVPYLRSGKIPVVFCGVNWDASVYGYPTENITGMLEVTMLKEGHAMLSRFAKGKRVAYLAAQSESEVKNLDIYNKRHFEGALNGYLVRTFDEFTAAFDVAQQQYDMLILGGNGGIQGWDDRTAQVFMVSHTRKPTCSFDDYMADFAIFSFAKDPPEQGEWMASAALRILEGVRPVDIPMVEN